MSWIVNANIEGRSKTALLNNRRLQAAYNELAVAKADLVRASLPPNPTFSLMRISGSGELEIERRIIAECGSLFWAANTRRQTAGGPQHSLLSVP